MFIDHCQQHGHRDEPGYQYHGHEHNPQHQRPQRVNHDELYHERNNCSDLTENCPPTTARHPLNDKCHPDNNPATRERVYKKSHRAGVAETAVASLANTHSDVVSHRTPSGDPQYYSQQHSHNPQSNHHRPVVAQHYSRQPSHNPQSNRHRPVVATSRASSPAPHRPSSSHPDIGCDAAADNGSKKSKSSRSGIFGRASEKIKKRWSSKNEKRRSKKDLAVDAGDLPARDEGREWEGLNPPPAGESRTLSRGRSDERERDDRGHQGIVDAFPSLGADDSDTSLGADDSDSIGDDDESHDSTLSTNFTDHTSEDTEIDRGELMPRIENFLAAPPISFKPGDSNVGSRQRPTAHDEEEDGRASKNRQEEDRGQRLLSEDDGSEKLRETAGRAVKEEMEAQRPPDGFVTSGSRGEPAAETKENADAEKPEGSDAEGSDAMEWPLPTPEPSIFREGGGAEYDEDLLHDSDIEQIMSKWETRSQAATEVVQNGLAAVEAARPRHTPRHWAVDKDQTFSKREEIMSKWETGSQAATEVVQNGSAEVEAARPRHTPRHWAVDKDQTLSKRSEEDAEESEVVELPSPRPKPPAFPEEGGTDYDEGLLYDSDIAEIMSKWETKSPAATEVDRNDFAANKAAHSQQSPPPWAVDKDQTFFERSEELRRENGNLSSELHQMKKMLIGQEEEMDSKVTGLEEELRKQENELKDMSEQEQTLKAMEEDAGIKLNQQVSQLTANLHAYKAECSSYRERILQKERDSAKTENSLREERERVRSLESEKTKLLSVAEDNAGHVTSSDRTKRNELNAYKEECDLYRRRVLDLERTALAAEGELEATGQIAKKLEQDRESLSAQLSQWKCNNTTLEAKNESLKSKLEEKDESVRALKMERSATETDTAEAKARTETDMAEAKTRADDNLKTVSILEKENTTLLQNLNDSTSSLAKLQMIAERCTNLEEENDTFKKRNDDLMAKQIKMSKEMNDAQGLASNTEHLHRMQKENESFISELQDDLSNARQSNLESLQKTRSECSAEKTVLADELHSQKKVQCVLEAKNNELEEKILLIECAHDELEAQCSNQTKGQDDQIMKLMEHAEKLRAKHAECQEENEKLTQELSQSKNVHARVVEELQSNLELLEKEQADAGTSHDDVNTELMELRERKRKEEEDFERIIHDKEDALVSVQSDFTEYVADTTAGTESLHATIRELERDLEQVTSSREALEKQVHEVKRHFLDAMNSTRTEKTTLLSDVQSRILDEKVALMKHVKCMVSGYGERAEKYRLEQSMRHSVAMTAFQLEKREMERFLIKEKEKTDSLETSLDKARADYHDFVETLNDVCRKLSVESKELLGDAIDDVLIDRSDARTQVRTLEADMTILKSNNSNLEYENNALTKQMEEKENQAKELKSNLGQNHCTLRVQTEEITFLEKKLEKSKQEAEILQDQMREEFNADQIAQGKLVEEAISAKEDAFSRQQERVEALTKEVAIRDEQLVELQVAVDDSREESKGLASRYEDLASEYEECRGQLASLLDKTITSKNKADELMSHYMNIEDKLRKQLHLVQYEMEGSGRKLLEAQRELDRATQKSNKEKCELKRQIEELKNSKSEAQNQLDTLSNEIIDLKQGLHQEKDDLTSALASKEESIQKLEKQIDEVEDNQHQARKHVDTLSIEIGDLKQENSELNERYEQVCNARDYLSRKMDKIALALAELESLKSKEKCELERQIEELKNSKMEAQNQLDTLSSEIVHLRQGLYQEKDDLASTLALKEESIQKLEKQVDKMHDECNCLSRKEEKLASALAELESSKDKEKCELERQIEELKNSKIEAQNQLDTLSNEIADMRQGLYQEKDNLTSTLALKEESIQKLEKQVDEMEDNKKQARKQVDALSIEIGDLKQENSESNNRYERVCFERDCLSSKEEKLVSALAELESSKGAKLKELSSMMCSDRAKHTDAMEALRNEIHGIKIERDSMTHQVQNLSSTLAALQSSRDANDGANEELKLTLENERLVHSKALRTLQNDFSDTTLERDSLTQQIAVLQSSHDAKAAINKKLKSTLEEERIVHNNALRTLQNDIHRITTERDPLNQRVQKMASLLSALQSRYDANDVTCKELKLTLAEEQKVHTHAMKTLENDIHSTIKERDSLNRQVQELNSTQAALQSSHDAKDAMSKDLKSTLEEERMANTRAVESLQNDISSITLKKKSLAEHVQNLTSVLETLQSSQHGRDDTDKEMKLMLDEERKVHDHALRTLQNDIRDITMERDRLNQWVKKLNSVLEVLQSSQDTKDTTIKNLESRLGEVRLVHNTNIEDLQGDIDRTTMEKDGLTQQIEELTSTMAELKSSNETEIQRKESSIEIERLMHGKTVVELQSAFNLELKQQQLISKTQFEKSHILAEEAKKLRQDVDKMIEIKSDQERQILKLNYSLKDASEEALRLGSMVTSEQAKQAELTLAMSSLDTKNIELKKSLRSSRSEGAQNESYHSDLELSLKTIVKEKQYLEVKLAAKETKLVKTMHILTRFELKLTKAELERDGQCAESARLHDALCSMEKLQQDKEKDLIDQIAPREKMQDKEMYHNSRVCSMKKEVESLKKELESVAQESDELTLVNETILAKNESLTEEKNRLTLVNDYILAEKSSLAENVALLESKLSAIDRDDISTTSSASRASHIFQTASELETAIRATKKHHDETIMKLQSELNDTHKRLKKYERKVKELAKVIGENTFVIEALHEKLRGKKRTQNSLRTPTA